MQGGRYAALRGQYAPPRGGYRPADAGFNFLSNERPVVVVVGEELTAFVPFFEVARPEEEGSPAEVGLIRQSAH